jgi:probable phosphoglycerate mutase
MLYLIRHEETPLNAAGRNRGTDDPPLSPKGRQDAASTGRMLRGKVDRIVADSPKRTQETAKIISGGKHVETDARLKTLDIGEYSGKKATASSEKEFDSKYIDHPERKIPGGESVNTWLPKWKATYKDYLQQSKHENIALVTHGRPVSSAVHGFTTDSLKEKNVPKLGCCVFQVGGDGKPKQMKAPKVVNSNPAAPAMKLSQLARA